MFTYIRVMWHAPEKSTGEDGLPVPDYVDENVSTKIVKIIQSYVGIVNKMVWRKWGYNSLITKISS